MAADRYVLKARARDFCRRDVRRRASAPHREAMAMSLGTLLVVILILILLGVFPRWDYSRSWGYGPSGLVGTLLVVVLILLLLGRI